MSISSSWVAVWPVIMIKPGIEFCFGLCHEEYRRWALAGAGHCVVLHCVCSAGPICYAVNQLRYFEKRGGDAV